MRLPSPLGRSTVDVLPWLNLYQQITTRLLGNVARRSQVIPEPPWVFLG
jgi:hypothetical protein